MMKIAQIRLWTVIRFLFRRAKWPIKPDIFVRRNKNRITCDRAFQANFHHPSRRVLTTNE